MLVNVTIMGSKSSNDRDMIVRVHARMVMLTPTESNDRKTIVLVMIMTITKTAVMTKHSIRFR